MDQTLIELLLVVEDNDADALLLDEYLAASPLGKFCIKRAATMREALDLLNSTPFEAVLLDLGLPDSQGLETLKKVQKHNTAKVPIVVLTGLDDQSMGISALQEGADDYLVKTEAKHSLRAIRYAVERSRAQKAIRVSEERLAMAVDAAELGIFDWDIQSGALTWSFHYARLLGLPDAQVHSTLEGFQQSVHPEDRPGMEAAIKQSLEALQEFRHEYRVVWPDGSEHWIEGRGKIATDEQDHPVRLMGTIMDVSQRKLAAEVAKIRSTELARLAQAKLTPREITLLKLVVAGMPNKRIAVDLNISVKTVAKHRAHLMAKTQALNAADLARMSALAGISTTHHIDRNAYK